MKLTKTPHDLATQTLRLTQFIDQQRKLYSRNTPIISNEAYDALVISLRQLEDVVLHGKSNPPISTSVQPNGMYTRGSVYDYFGTAGEQRYSKSFEKLLTKQPNGFSSLTLNSIRRLSSLLDGTGGNSQSLEQGHGPLELTLFRVGLAVILHYADGRLHSAIIVDDEVRRHIIFGEHCFPKQIAYTGVIDVNVAVYYESEAYDAPKVANGLMAGVGVDRLKYEVRNMCSSEEEMDSFKVFAMDPADVQFCMPETILIHNRGDAHRVLDALTTGANRKDEPVLSLLAVTPDQYVGMLVGKRPSKSGYGRTVKATFLLKSSKHVLDQNTGAVFTELCFVAKDSVPTQMDSVLFQKLPMIGNKRYAINDVFCGTLKAGQHAVLNIAQSRGEQLIVDPVKCPVCKHPLIEQSGHRQGLYCESFVCNDLSLTKVESFFARYGRGLAVAKTDVLKDVVALGMANHLKDIVDILMMSSDEIAAVVGEEAADNIAEHFQAFANASFADQACVLSISGFGAKTYPLLAEVVGSFGELLTCKDFSSALPPRYVNLLTTVLNEPGNRDKISYLANWIEENRD